MTFLPPGLKPSTAFDLHLHTSASDGKYTLDEVLTRCALGGLDVVAITDHDLSLDLVGGPHIYGGRELHVIPGAEVSGVHDGREYHLLVYFPQGVPQGFVDFCRHQCLERTERFLAACKSLALDLARPESAKAITRLHMAHALVDAGVVSSRSEAFSHYLGDSHGHVPHLRLPFTEAIALARSFGGVTSWAHPPRDAATRYLSTFVEAGLQGLEVLRPRINSADRKLLKKLAKRNGLFLTGGSDWHGWSGGEPGLFRVDAGQITGFVDTVAA